MFRFTQKSGRMTCLRRRNHQLTCEALESRQLLSGYYIVNEASGKVLDNSLSTINGTVIDQWQLYGGTNQQWNLVPQANGTDEIQNAQSGLLLTATSGSEGDKIIQDQWLGGYTIQEWTVSLGAGVVGNGNYVNVGFKNAYSGLYLDNPQSSQSNGTPTIQWPLDYGANQRWTLLAANSTAPAMTFNVVNAGSSQELFQQQCVFIPLADSFYLIVSASSGEVLDDPDFSNTPGTQIQPYQLNGGLNQQWYLNPAAQGFYIINASSNLFLDDPGGLTSGRYIIQGNFDGDLNQNWQLS